MQAIRAGLTVGQEGEGVADLHLAIDALGLGAGLPEEERAARRYGDRTAELVRALQSRLDVVTENAGMVDEPTAAAINAALLEQGTLRLVRGQVRGRDGGPLVGNLLMAFDVDNLGGAYLAATNTDPEGAYTAYYDPRRYAVPAEGVLRVKDVIDLVVQVYDQAGTTLAASDPLHDPPSRVRVDLTQADEPPPPPPPPPPGDAFAVHGQVVGPEGPVDGVDVAIFDRDLGEVRQPLGVPAVTDHDGRFEIGYDLAAFASAEGEPAGRQVVADLIFTLSRQGVELDHVQVTRLYPAVDGEPAREEPVDDDDLPLGVPARPVERVRLFVPDLAPTPGMSEYERLWRALEPMLPDQAPPEADDVAREARVVTAARALDEPRHRDVSFAARETGLDRRLVQAFVDAARLAAEQFDGAVPVAVCYGLARLRGVTDVLSLARLSTEDLRSGLFEAGVGAAPVIPAQTPVQIEAAVSAIRDLLAGQAATYRPAPEVPTLAELLHTALPDGEDQATLWRVWSEHSGAGAGSTAAVWTALRAEPGFADPQKVARTQLTFQLGLLTHNNPALIGAIHERHPDAADTTQLALRMDSTQTWVDLLTESQAPIPAVVPGDTVAERTANYAEAMAGAMQVIHPTAAVTNLVGSLDPAHLDGAQPGVARFLSGAIGQPGFDLSSTRLDDFAEEHADAVLGGVDPVQRPLVLDQVKRVQRLFRLSTGPDPLAALLDAGFDSAYSIARLSREAFIDRLGAGITQPQQMLAYHRATEITKATTSTHILLNDALNGVAPGSMVGDGGLSAVRAALAKHVPGYATLFGSLELCDCTQCRSIHSPAAYLTDLLQFLDGAGTNAAGLTPLDVLIGNPAKGAAGRRPDLAHILLSCENTNTPLPYVDLVNEALESYLVFGQTLPLVTDATGVPLAPPVPDPNESSPGVTAEELAANPEHRRDHAYEALGAAVYPFTLPFNQPLTATRLALDQAGTSRHELLTMLRRDDGPAADRAIDAEALGLSAESFAALTGTAFDSTPRVRPTSDYYGYPAPADPADTIWVGGALPAGAQQHLEGDNWAFAPSAEPPPSGVDVHTSSLVNGVHQHFFDGVPAASAIRPGSDDVFFTEVLLDPATLPEQVMLQWNDGTWEHRAFWGASRIPVGLAGTASLRYQGPLPAAGQWIRLEVPARLVGLGGRPLAGAAFTLWGGTATWGASGVRTPSWLERLTRVPTLLARTGVSYVDVIELLRTRFLNPSLPTSAELTFFERIPFDYSTLAELAAGGYAAVDTRIQLLLDDAGISVAELSDWAGAHLAALGRMLVLEAPDASCDLELTSLRHLDGSLPDEAELTRLHRFIRLWRSLDWSIPDVDRALASFGAEDVTPEAVSHLSTAVQLQRALKLTPQELLSLWGPLPTTGDDALYRKLFANRAVRALGSVFEPTAGEYLPLSAGLHIADSVPALRAALRLRAVDLDRIRAAARIVTPDRSLAGDDAALTLATATLMFRYAVLARALALSIPDLITMVALTGQDPFSVLSAPEGPFTDVAPARTLRFVELAERVRHSGFAVSTLGALFGAPDATTPAPADAPALDPATQRLLVDLRDGLLRLAADNTPAEDPTGELTRTRLGSWFEAEVVARIAALVDGTARYTAPLTTLPAALPAGRVSYDPSSGLLAATGWLSDTELGDLLATSGDPDFQAAVRSVYQQPRDLVETTLVAGLGWHSAAADLRAAVLEAPMLVDVGDVENVAAAIAARYTAFLAALLPYLMDVLARSMVRQCVGDALRLDPATVALLLEGRPDGTAAAGEPIMTAKSAPGRPAMADFLALTGDGLTATSFGNPDLAGAGEPPVIDATVSFRWPGRHGFSTRWQASLLAERTGPVSLHVRAAGGVRLFLDGTLLIDRWLDDGESVSTSTVAMTAGQLYDLRLEYRNLAAEALLELRWSTPLSGPALIPQRRLYTRAAAASDHAGTTLSLLRKAATLATGFKLTAAELAELADPARPGALRLDDLPVEPTAEPGPRAALFEAWTGWSDYAALRSLVEADPIALPAVLGAATPGDALAALVRATGCDAAALEAAVSPFGFGFAATDYADTARLRGLAEAIRLLALIGASVGQGFVWADPLADLPAHRKTAQEAWHALRTRYDEDTWPEVARPLTDELREAQRAALVAYLVPRLGCADPGELFDFFLIDVEMSPCMMTSRIKQAISSVQLFVQRARMNLEPQVAPGVFDALRWQWMRNYRVWEANRKVFLYPENWIEPELRDDKSPFFRELESELLQGDLTALSAEVAVGNYVAKLGTVADLQLCGMCTQRDFEAHDDREEVLHVFGRSYAAPRAYYYRQRVTVSPAQWYWTAWERVPTEIQADEVLPVIWNRRLYIFWTVSTSKQKGDNSYVDIRLAWSEYRAGAWSPKQQTPAESAIAAATSACRLDVDRNGDELKITLALAGVGGVSFSGIKMDKYGNVTKSEPEAAGISRQLGTFTFRNYNGLVDVVDLGVKKVVHKSGFLAVGSANLTFVPAIEPETRLPILARAPSVVYLFAPGSKPYTLNDPFFLQEGPRAYLALPKSFAPPAYGYLGSLESGAAYLPGLAGKASAGSGGGAANALTDRPIAAEMAVARTETNPWLSGRASLASMELQPLIEAGKPPSAAGSALSKESAAFDLGAITAGVQAVFGYGATIRFETLFHPYAAEFQRRLNRGGVPALLSLNSQQSPTLPAVGSFAAIYGPTGSVAAPYPTHDVDFSYLGAYSQYNWELFLHIPLLIGTRLGQSQRFEEAVTWFQYIFDPTAGTAGDTDPARFWRVLPLRTTPAERIDQVLGGLHAGDPAAVAQWEDAQAHPFQPHRLARLRRSAYQKSVVMKYYDVLIAWADQLFRQDTLESIQQAVPLYLLVAAQLGRSPQRMPARGGTAARTFAQLRPALDRMGQAMVQFENDLPYKSTPTLGTGSNESTGLLGVGSTAYFCVPRNDRLLGYWDTIADRLFKIRNCQNIDGVTRQLALFEPPIDPGLLVRATAAGLDIGAVLADLSAPLPAYRFTTMMSKALEVAAEVRSLGAALLATLEKRDGERLAALRAGQETDLLRRVSAVKRQQLDEARTAAEGIRRTREVTQVRYDYYSTVAQRIGEELNQVAELADAQHWQEEAQSAESTASDIATYSPDISTGATASATGGPFFSITLGRGNVIAYYQAKSRDKGYQASMHTYHATLSSILAGWSRRSDDWKLQRDLAAKELAQIDKQIAAAEIRVAIAEREADNAELEIEQSAEVQDFLRNKYTGEDLYAWMQGQLQTTYFQCYQLAYDLAKKAERCYRFERGLTSSDFIRFGSWDGARKGLLAGENLYLQLKQLERAYLDDNRREYELTRHYSLVLNDPQAFVRLKAQGWCEIDLPEALFDSDYPGHHLRRIRTVGLTIPAVVGPYSGVNCTLRLLKDTTRVKSTLGDGYVQRDGEEDDRFVTNWAPVQAIATSSGQNDSGMFEATFRDERYLPFEGAGVISRWRLEMDARDNAFDPRALSDVILHLHYTARDGGDRLRNAAREALAEAVGVEAARPQARLISLKHEFGPQWYRLTGAPGAAAETFPIGLERFPFLFRNRTVTSGDVYLYAVLEPGAAPSPMQLTLTPPGADPEVVKLAQRRGWSGLLAPEQPLSTAVRVVDQSDGNGWRLASGPTGLPKEVDDLILVCEYAVTS